MNVDEFYLRKSTNQRRSKMSHGRSKRQMIRISMDMRVRDEERHLKEMKEKQNEARKALADLYGRDSMKFKRRITKLNRWSAVEGKKQDQRHEGQLLHLKRKHEEARREREAERLGKYQVKWKEKFRGVEVYEEDQDSEEFQELLREVDRELEEQEPLVIGGAQLSKEEGTLLKYPPGTAVVSDLNEFEFRSAQE